MASALDDVAAFHHQNLVGLDHGGEPVRDDEAGAAAGDFQQFGLDGFFGFGVERRGGFVAAFILTLLPDDASAGMPLESRTTTVVAR